MDTALLVRNLCVPLSNKKGIIDISFTVNRGDIYVLYGGHEACKSLLLETINGTILHKSGVIKLFDNENYSQEKCRIGYVPQTPVTIGSMTINELIRYFSLSFGSLADEYEVILKPYLIQDKKPVRRLPLFTKKIVNLAIALLSKPDMVLIDEPFLGLDQKEIEQFTAIITLLNQNNDLTFLITGDNYNALSRVATQYGIISNGKIYSEITPKQLEEKCKRCIKIRTPNLQKALPLLIGDFSEYEVLTDDLIRVFCSTSRSSEINTILVSNGIIVSELSVAGMEHEEYLSKLLGGGRID